MKNEKSLGTAADVRSQLEKAAAEMKVLKAAEKEIVAAEKVAQKAADKKAADEKKAADLAAGIVPEKKEKAPAKPKVDVLALALNAILAVEGVDDVTKKLFQEAILAAMPKEAEKSEKVEGPGVIKSIFKIIAESGEEGISKAGILKALVAMFPDRDQFGMVSTVRAQLIPSRIVKDNHPCIALPNGNFRGVVK